jgi:hypothetical protein
MSLPQTENRIKIEKILNRALELKMAFDLPNHECVKRAIEEFTSK